MNAICGALAAGAIILLDNGLRSRPVEAEVCQEADDALREDLRKTRLEFVEFRAEVRADFKAVHQDLGAIRTDLDEIKRLLKAKQ